MSNKGFNQCPRCKSEDITQYKSGNYHCYNCGYTWTKGIKNSHKGKVKCVECGSYEVMKYRKRNKRQTWLCKECGAMWTNKTHIKIRPSERKEWIKFIKNEVKRGIDLNFLKEYLIKTIGIKERTAYLLIQQAIGPRVRKITEKDILKAIEYKNMGFDWQRIASILGFNYRVIRQKVNKYLKEVNKND